MYGANLAGLICFLDNNIIQGFQIIGTDTRVWIKVHNHLIVHHSKRVELANPISQVDSKSPGRSPGLFYFHKDWRPRLVEGSLWLSSSSWPNHHPQLNSFFPFVFLLIAFFFLAFY